MKILIAEDDTSLRYAFVYAKSENDDFFFKSA